MASSLSPFFNAAGVAILGASSNPKKLSYGILENMLKYGYTGKVYPVNPNAQEILGQKCYPDIASVPDPVELAVIVLPVTMILETLEACGKRGVKAVVIITGGFREVGADGAELERKSLEIVRRYGMRAVGPNCVGTMDCRTGLNSTFIRGMPVPGPIAFVSQSGAVAGGVVDLIIESQIGFSHFASLGNEMDVSEADMIEYFGDDPNVKVIAVYLEGVQNGPRFIEMARKVSRKKPIVMLKAGKNDAGAKAVSSHTGSLAGSYSAYQAAFEQSGVLEVQSLDELFNVAWSLGTQPLPRGRRVAIATNAGGGAALAADALALNGFELAEISAENQAALREKLNPSAQVGNPIDMLGAASPDEYHLALKHMIADDGVDILYPIYVPQALVNPGDIAQAWADAAKTTDKTFLSSLIGMRSTKEAEALLNTAGVPVFRYPHQGGEVLAAMQKYSGIRSSLSDELIRSDGKSVAASKELLGSFGGLKALGEHETRQLLDLYQIPNVPGRLASTADEAAQIADEIGFPVVLKIVAEGILHKSDVGGIVLNLAHEADLRAAFEDLIEKISRSNPEAQIRGAMVEKMAPKGLELIVGMKQDPTFGPMILFGSGGVMVELLKDVATRIAPLSERDIDAMIESTLAGKLLAGYRGSRRADIGALKEVIRKLSVLAQDHPEIAEIEINPLIVYPEGEGALAIDSRAIMH